MSKENNEDNVFNNTVKSDKDDPFAETVMKKNDPFADDGDKKDDLFENDGIKSEN